MKKVILLDKKVGQTPLECIRECVAENPSLKDEKVGYAGRLDPMAEGLMVMLVGEENKNREHYLGLDKEYEVDILFGVSTDSYDVMGIVQTTKNVDISGEEVDEVAIEFCGNYVQSYPPFSSKPVDGKPLFYWAHHGLLDMIEIPEELRHIYDIEVLDESYISSDELVDFATQRIHTVHGEFRQDEIIEEWENWLERHKSEDFSVITVRVHASSGTYMRQLAVDIGEALGVPAMAIAIRRTRIGDWDVDMLNALQ